MKIVVEDVSAFKSEDGSNKVQEKDERNNENTVRFSFGRSLFNKNNGNSKNP